MEFSILQALKHNAKSRMTQNIGVLCHQCTLYIVQVMGELVIFKTFQPYLTCVQKNLLRMSQCCNEYYITRGSINVQPSL